jgi:hypothetical protein
MWELFESTVKADLDLGSGLQIMLNRQALIWSVLYHVARDVEVLLGRRDEKK